jgi:transposase
LAAYVDEVKELRERKVELAAIRLRLQERHGVAVSYEALRRMVRKMEPRTPETFVRVESAPGEESQVDFGYAGLTVDPKTGALRKTWFFVMTLSYSRHMYAHLVYKQNVETWIDCHIKAFEYFGGVPGRIVLDNLKAAILKACTEDPLVQLAYRELAEHYGFLIDPNPPAMPHLKGKVESGVHYVARNFLAGQDEKRTDLLNAKLSEWLVTTAGMREHGTTREAPLARFHALESAALQGLPAEAYDTAAWKKVKLHRDCHFSFERAWYSAPCNYVGQELWLRGGLRCVRAYNQRYELVAAHDRVGPGGRQTLLAHMPPEKLSGLTLSRDGVRRRAQTVGPATSRIVARLLENQPVDKRRVADRLLKLADLYDDAALEAACQLAESYGENDYRMVKDILKGSLVAAPAVAETPADKPKARLFRFARPLRDYALTSGGSGR